MLAASHKGTIDRIEGEFAVMELDSGGFIDLPLSSLPGCAREGTAVTSRCGPNRCTLRAHCIKTAQSPPLSPIQIRSRKTP